MARKTYSKSSAFIVSWFPMNAKEAATMLCLSRERADERAQELLSSFAPYIGYDPIIRVDRTEVKIPL